jgi:peptide/nickel transport system permease protein
MLRYIFKRILVLIPIGIVLSFVSFIIIQLPPGDFLSSYIQRLRATGAVVDDALIVQLEKQYGLNESFMAQYFKWVSGFPNGNLGYSFLFRQPVTGLIKERLGLTIAMALSSMVLVWLIAFPLGFYSATHRHRFLDGFIQSASFFGMSIPEFMLALVILWIYYKITGSFAGGLFSARYIDQPMSWAKFLDMVNHLWIPFLIIVVTQTAGLFKTFRVNLIDEINKPYMKTAVAKGLSYRRALIKYPVRIALIPFIATVGWALPGLISGQTILAIVMDLPTVAPLLTSALKGQDMYLAGGVILILGFLTMIGTLLSDIFLALADPRIRNSL